MSKVILTVSGKAGTGKTTVALLLAKELGLRYISAGKVFREMCRREGKDFVSFHKYAEENPDLDRKVDETLKAEAERGNVVLDGRLAGWMAGDKATLKIYLFAPQEECIKRIVERNGLSYSDAFKEYIEREQSNKKRYLKFYGIDIDDLSIYDLVFNTKLWRPREIVKLVKYAVSLLKGR